MTFTYFCQPASFHTSPAIFFELIGRPATEASGYEFRSVEVKQPDFRIDGFFIPGRNSAAQTVYFVEVQFQIDLLLYHRLFAELFLYLKQNPATKDWRAVLIYPRRSLEPNQTNLYRTLLESLQVQRVYLDELAAAELLLGLGLVQLVMESEAQAGNRARQLLEQNQQEAVAGLSQRGIVKLIMVYKLPQLNREEIEEMLGLSELKQTRVYQEAREEGRQEEGVTLVLRLLTRRVGQLTPEMRSQIQQLRVAQLKELGEALLDFSSMQDLTDWLQHSSGES